MATRMQQRRGTAAQWTSANPILAAGEIGFETDTGKFKMGNGSSAWTALSYFADASDFDTSAIESTIDSKVATAVNTLVAGAPAALNTLNELAAAIDNNSTFATAITTALSTKATLTQVNTHEARTTAVHGIADTAALATMEYADDTADAAQAAAIAAAAADATSKANTAKSEAISAAATDATAKANDAQTAAIAAAAADATTKANAAQTAAELTASNALSLESAARVSAISEAMSNHSSATENIHGIENTANLATKTYADNSSTTAVSNHNGASTNVHGIADTANLVTLAGVQTLTNKTITSPSGLVKADVGLSNVDNTSDANKPISTAAQTALDLKAPLASPTFTGTVVLPTVTAGGSIVPSTDNTYDLGSPTKMWKDVYVGPGSLYVNGQKVIQDDSGNIVLSADTNENLALRTSGSGNVELDPTGTGNIQVKGTLSIQAGSQITSSDGNAIVFGNAINTDTLSSKTADTDLSLSGKGTGKVYVNDNAEVSGNLVVGGNLTVSGTTTTVNSETIALADNIIDLNSNFTTGNPTENAGLKIKRGDSSDVQLRWNESSDVWQFTNDGSTYDNIAGKTELDLKAPLNSPTFTGTVTLPAAGIVFSDGTQSKAGVPSITTIAPAMTSSATLSAGEQDKFVPLAGAVTITLPATGYSTGQSIDFYQASGTGAQFASTNNVVGTPGLKFRTTYSVVTAMRISGGWLVFGDLSA